MKPYSENMKRATRSLDSMKANELNIEKVELKYHMFDCGVEFADKEYQDEIERLDRENKLLKDKIVKLQDELLNMR